jgi:site-specific DNA-methyltransferase (adenine-specific)
VKLILGDFFSEIESIPDASVDLAIVDPPYFLSRGGFTVSSGKSVSVDKGEWDKPESEEATFQFHQRWISQLKRVLKANGAVVVSGTYHSIYECGHALTMEKFHILNEIVWFKPNGAPNLSGRRLAASHETLIWAAKDSNSKHTFNYEELKIADFPGDPIKKPGKQMRSVWWIPTTPKREREFGHHPAQKPEALIERIVNSFSKPGDLVFDPFMGSGTVGLVASRNNRNFLGIEKDSTYFELAQKRLKGLLDD